jgi:hypothetical protein
VDRVAAIPVRCIESACCDFRGFIRDGYCGLVIIMGLGGDALAFVPR